MRKYDKINVRRFSKHDLYIKQCKKQKACRDGEGKLMENEIKSFRMLKDTNKQTLRFCSVGIFKTGYWNLNKETRYLDHDNICMNKKTSL